LVVSHSFGGWYSTRTLSGDRKFFPVLSELLATYGSDHDVELDYREST